MFAYITNFSWPDQNLRLCQFTKASPPTDLGVCLLSVVERAFPWPKRAGLKCLQDGFSHGWDAGPEKAIVRPGGKLVFDHSGADFTKQLVSKS